MCFIQQVILFQIRSHGKVTTSQREADCHQSFISSVPRVHINYYLAKTCNQRMLTDYGYGLVTELCCYENCWNDKYHSE